MRVFGEAVTRMTPDRRAAAAPMVAGTARLDGPPLPCRGFPGTSPRFIAKKNVPENCPKP
jgi:hypothetical protein